MSSVGFSLGSYISQPKCQRSSQPGSAREHRPKKTSRKAGFLQTKTKKGSPSRLLPSVLSALETSTMKNVVSPSHRKGHWINRIVFHLLSPPRSSYQEAALLVEPGGGPLTSSPPDWSRGRCPLLTEPVDGILTFTAPAPTVTGRQPSAVVPESRTLTTSFPSQCWGDCGEVPISG